MIGLYDRDFLRSLHVEVCEIPEPRAAQRREDFSRDPIGAAAPVEHYRARLLQRSLWYLAFVAGVGLSVGLALRLGGW